MKFYFILNLSKPSEAEKIECAEKHFKTLGVNFDVVVDAGEV